MERFRRYLLRSVVLALASGACRGAVPATAATDAAPGTAADLVIALRVVDAASVAPGDTVHFVAVARNRSRLRVQVGTDCGPSLDVRITPPPGGEPTHSVLHAMLPPDVGFRCALEPHHFAAPRDSVVQHLWWRAPARAGTYTAVAGVRRDGALVLPSTPMHLTVR